METITINIKALCDFFMSTMLVINIFCLIGLIGEITNGYKKIFDNIRRIK